MLAAAETSYSQLLKLFSEFSRRQLAGEFPFPHRDRGVRDVLAHLYEWHLLFLTWYSAGMEGRIVPMPAPGYAWKDTPRLNSILRDKRQSTSLKQIRSKLHKTHHQLVQRVKDNESRELFEKRRYSWTGSTSLGPFLTSATSAHYNWAINLLQEYLLSLQHKAA